jgi:hypothetical protein
VTITKEDGSQFLLPMYKILMGKNLYKLPKFKTMMMNRDRWFDSDKEFAEALEEHTKKSTIPEGEENDWDEPDSDENSKSVTEENINEEKKNEENETPKKN